MMESCEYLVIGVAIFSYISHWFEQLGFVLQRVYAALIIAILFEWNLY